MANLAQALKDEIQRVARKEAKAQLAQTKRLVTEHRRTIAALKRENAELQRKVNFLERGEKKRLGDAPAAIPEGSRFSARSLKAQRRKTGLSQANYAKLVGVSTLTINNWETQRTKPRDEQFAKIVALRGLGKREAEKRLSLLS